MTKQKQIEFIDKLIACAKEYQGKDIILEDILYQALLTETVRGIPHSIHAICKLAAFLLSERAEKQIPPQ